MTRLRNPFSSRREAGRASAEAAPPPPAEVFVARQPVFTNTLWVDAYELLFRPSSVDSPFADLDLSLASTRVISLGLGTLGWDRLTGGHRALISATRELLLSDEIQLLPVATTILGVRADSVDAELVEACTRLRRAGYDLAIDESVLGSGDDGLASLATFVRVDLAAVPAPARTVVQRLRGRDIRVVATNVETREQFAHAKALGCTHFQGFFFRKPALVAGRETPGFLGNYQQLLAEVARPEADFARLEAIIKQDLSLSYKFLSFINSAAFGWSRRITSLRQALVLLGQEQLRRWVSLTAVASAVEGKPQELAVDAVVRARFCESLADVPALAGRALDLFMLGLFSTIDAVLDLPMGEAAARIPTSEDVRTALLGTAGPLRDVLDLVNAYGRGNWPVVSGMASRLRIPEEELPERYTAAVAWADEVFRPGAQAASQESSSGA